MMSSPTTLFDPIGSTAPGSLGSSFTNKKQMDVTFDVRSVKETECFERMRDASSKNAPDSKIPVEDREGEETFTVIGEGQECKFPFIEASAYAPNIKSHAISPTTALQRSRMKKRSIEGQLTAWREGIGRAKALRRRSTGSLDEIPPLVDCDGTESDGLESCRSRSQAAFLPPLVNCDEPYSMAKKSERSTSSSQNLPASACSFDEAESMISMAEFPQHQQQLKRSIDKRRPRKPRTARRERRASMGSVPMTTRRWISLLFFDKNSQTRSDDTVCSPNNEVLQCLTSNEVNDCQTTRSGKIASPGGSKDRRKSRRTSVDSKSGRKDAKEPDSGVEREQRRRSSLSLSPIKSTPGKCHGAIHQPCRGKMVMECSPQTTKPILSGVSSECSTMSISGSEGSNLSDKLSFSQSNLACDSSLLHVGPVTTGLPQNSNTNELGLLSSPVLKNPYNIGNRGPPKSTKFAKGNHNSSLISTVASIISTGEMGVKGSQQNKLDRRDKQKHCFSQQRRNSTGGSVSHVWPQGQQQHASEIHSPTMQPTSYVANPDIVCSGLKSRERVPSLHRQERRRSIGGTVPSKFIKRVQNNHVAHDDGKENTAEAHSLNNVEKPLRTPGVSPNVSKKPVLDYRNANPYAPITTGLRKEISLRSLKALTSSSQRSVISSSMDLSGNATSEASVTARQHTMSVNQALNFSGHFNSSGSSQYLSPTPTTATHKDKEKRSRRGRVGSGCVGVVTECTSPRPRTRRSILAFFRHQPESSANKTHGHVASTTKCLSETKDVVHSKTVGRSRKRHNHRETRARRRSSTGSAASLLRFSHQEVKLQ